MLKKLLISLVTAFFTALLIPSSAFAENSVNVYFFWGSGCPHCAKEKPFLESLEKKYQSLNVYKYEVWYDQSNKEFLKKVGSELDVNVSGVPFTIIGDKHFSGYLNDETTGKQLEDAITYCIEQTCHDPVGHMLGISDVVTNNSHSAQKTQAIPEKISVPLLGNIPIKNLSLPVLTILIGALDGFNPCAMWALLFLLSLLLGMHDRRRMWILGGTFIVTSALVYFLFMAAWLHLILFIGFIFWIRAAIALLGIGGGIYNLREYFVNKENACKVSRTEEHRRVFSSLKHYAREKNFWVALGGIILLAAAVNIVELICSAGLPVIYTQVLVMSDLPIWQYYLYMLLYIFVFMLDDLIVFFVSMKTLELTGITTKYSRFTHLIGGILMIVIALLLLFKPEWLMFG